MRKSMILLTAVAALIAFGGCAPKKSCNTAKKVAPTPKKEAAKVLPAVKAAPAPVVEAPEPQVIPAPAVDSKESAAQ